MKSKFILIALLSILAFSCKKDKVAPALTIGAPGDGAQAKGVVVITGTVTDENLSNMTIKITKDASGIEVYNKQLSLDGLTVYNYNEQYDPGVVVSNTNVTMVVEVSDKNNSKTSKTVKFTLIP